MPREMLSDRDHGRILELSWALAGARSSEELTAMALEKMHRLVGAEETGFQRVDLRRSKMQALAYPPDTWISQNVLSRFDLFARIQNPIFAEILGGRSTPFNLSRIIPLTEFLRSEFYELGYEPRGVRYQSIVPVEINRKDLSGIGYTFSRSSKDFSDRDACWAYALQSVLAAHHAALKVKLRSERQINAAPPRRELLTERELEVFKLVASGMTAVAIAHVLRISPRTVRKHIENSYSKLDIHDRLQAASYCRQAGLISY